MDKKIPKIFVIVLNFNGAETLPGCLASVFQSDYPNFETIVIDNDSQDGSFEKARLSYSRAHFIKNSANVGFSKGNNVGIRYALEKFADYVFVLNNDATIEKDTLTNLVTISEKNPSFGIVSPLILNADNKSIWFAGGVINWKKMQASHLTAPPSDEPYASEYLSGCAMFIKKEVFKKIGLFDERFFLYYEDADFSLRTKAAGFDLMVAPMIKVCHLEQSNTTNNSKIYWLVLSGMLFFQTHATLPQKFWLAFYMIIRRMKNFYNLTFSANKAAQDVKKAYSDYKKIPK